MVTAIAEGDTTQWEAINWVIRQGRYNTGTEQSVLFYLAAQAFYTKDNPEGAVVGQVLRDASKAKNIQVGTGIKSRHGLRTILNRLQDKAYIQREERPPDDFFGQRPNIIYVLWTPDAEELRQGLRDGSRRLPMALMMRPTGPSENPKTLAVVRPIRTSEGGQ